ncbi:MAG: PAC2 family protein [Micrococcales bacterium]
MARRYESGRTLLVAFQGWNDAAEAATGVLKFLAEQFDGDVVSSVDPEDYYDFQFTRPNVALDSENNRSIEWPNTELIRASADSVASNPRFGEIFLLSGTEPARRWQSFTAEMLEMVEDCEIDQVIFLGAMLSDTPHTRPIKVTMTSQNDVVRNELNIERSTYEGPIGILAVMGIALEAAGIPTLSLWASVPHYVHNAASPKATLSMLIEVEGLLGVQFDHGSLADEAFTWERGIDEVAEGDDDMASYIQQLEKTRDLEDEAEGSAETLAHEFERFLAADASNKDAPDSDGTTPSPETGN